MEQTARALNTLCQRWLLRRSRQSQIDRVCAIIQYHQSRNQAAKRSRLQAAAASG